MTMKKGGLGKGLGSLFEETAGNNAGAKDSVVMLRLGEVEPDKNQPRKAFEDAALSELASSIMEHGVLQPIVVRSAPNGVYKIVAGERRWRASRLAGQTEIPALVKDITEAQAMEIALVENLQREDLDPIEEATGYHQLMERCNYTQEQAAVKLSKSRSAVANSLRLLQLPAKVVQYLREGKLFTGHAKVILSLRTPALQQEVADCAVKEGLNVRQTELLCKKMAKEPKQKHTAQRSAFPSEVEISLQEVLGTKVQVQYKEGKGRLQVEFYSDEQLKAFANLLGKYQIAFLK